MPSIVNYRLRSGRTGTAIGYKSRAAVIADLQQLHGADGVEILPRRPRARPAPSRTAPGPRARAAIETLSALLEGDAVGEAPTSQPTNRKD